MEIFPERWKAASFGVSFVGNETKWRLYNFHNFNDLKERQSSAKEDGDALGK